MWVTYVLLNVTPRNGATVGAVAVPALRHTKTHTYIPRTQLDGLVVTIRFRTENETWIRAQLHNPTFPNSAIQYTLRTTRANGYKKEAPTRGGNEQAVVYREHC